MQNLPNGSWMELSKVKDYVIENELNIGLSGNDVFECNGIAYIRTSLLKSQLPVDNFRKMQSYLTTTLVGLESIL